MNTINVDIELEMDDSDSGGYGDSFTLRNKAVEVVKAGQGLEAINKLFASQMKKENVGDLKSFSLFVAEKTADGYELLSMVFDFDLKWNAKSLKKFGFKVDSDGDILNEDDDKANEKLKLWLKKTSKTTSIVRTPFELDGWPISIIYESTFL